MSSRKKRRQRGSKTHGGGSMKKRRGAGHRGGRGRAGSGKKGDAKKPRYWKDKKKKGFKSVQQKKGDLKVINISKINETLDTLESEGKVKKVKGVYQIDLKGLGYDKLLGAGSPSGKYNVTVGMASDSAVEKIEKAGGSISLTKGKEAEA